jgi:V8-like Glu-specific endopeptidase
LMALAATCLIGAACTTTVQARPAPDSLAPVMPPAPARPETVDLLSKFEYEPKETADYWKNRDLGEGSTRDTGIPDGEAPNDESTGLLALPTDGSIIGADKGVGLGDSDEGAPMPSGGLKTGTTGRLYMSESASSSSYAVCSATVVNSASHDILATAAHCVWLTDTQAPLRNVMFVPGERDDGREAPYGRWYAAESFIRPEFEKNAFSDEDDGTVSGAGWAYDYAFIRLAPNDGKKIQDVVGAQGIAFGIPAESLVVIGYPTAPPFDGRSERYCSSTRWSRYSMGGYSIDCVMTAGSSGGGWFTRWDPERAAGYLVATTSTGDDVSMNAVVLGRSAYQLFEAAGAVSDGLFEAGGGL